MRAKMRVAIKDATEKRNICPESTAEEMLDCAPPEEIGDGHLLPDGERALRKHRLTFGSIPRRERAQVERSMPIVPDKRARPEPTKAKIPPRDGGPVLF